MNYTDFATLIKQNRCGGAYLFHGEEEFVKDGLLHTLLQSLDEGTRALNVETFELAEFAPIYAACETLPFFSERRVVVCRALATEEDANRFVTYFDRVPPTTTLLFFVRGKAADNRTMVKALKAAGREVLFSQLMPAEAIKWMMQRAKACSVTISESSARYFIELVGTDMTALSDEFEKAAAYVGENNELTRGAIDAVVKPSLESNTFRILDLLSCGKKEEGFSALKKLLDTGAGAMGLAALFDKRMQTVLKARKLIEKDTPRNEVVKALGFPTSAAQMGYDYAKRHTYAQIAEVAKAFTDVGFLNNSGAMTDEQALELAFFKYFLC